MFKAFHRSSRWTLLFCLSSGLLASTARAQVTATQRQLQRLDLSVNGIGVYTKSVQGTNYQGVAITQTASNTLGALVTLRYTKSPLFGAEINYSYARFTERFSNYIVGGAQTNASEYTVGYVAHGPNLLGLQTFASGGVGTIAFRPTPFGGQGLPARARLAYYYSVGLEQPVFSSHFGVRAQFRQIFYKAPDFDQNYLTINRRTFTSEPAIGFYLHY